MRSVNRCSAACGDTSILALRAEIHVECERVPLGVRLKLFYAARYLDESLSRCYASDGERLDARAVAHALTVRDLGLGSLSGKSGYAEEDSLQAILNADTEIVLPYPSNPVKCTSSL
jgi:hypothetical protein